MTKWQKKNLIETVRTLIKTQKEMRQLFEQLSVDLLKELLVNCQTVAVSIGNQIEESEGEGTKAVSLLEEYCELVYQIFESVDMIKAEGQLDQIFDNMEKLLCQIGDEVEEAISARYEVVFAPYKAAMWDSLESIWRAAEGDENCNAIVMPIPYYDRNSDGSFKLEHYEGELFPEDVPITDYKTYDFENIHPDAIFIHNPYDDCNYVTSVHPFFYSANLKKYTDTLVYVPYYATAGGMGDGQRNCSAYHYVDYIVIQSEKFVKFFDESIPRDKFLPLGSPKFDNVIRLCQNPPEIRPEWKEIIAGRKVYFYNTSLSGMLENTPQFLLKMEYVFNAFKNHPEACLLWRPHPLMESTFDSMRAAYKPIYESLKRRFINENLGIYDTTPSIENTIAICDAYVGDAGTSVTSLFGVVGKPMFILDNAINMLPNETDLSKTIIMRNELECTSDWHITITNQLWHRDADDNWFHYICDLCDYIGHEYYIKAFNFNDKLYICPRNAQDIKVIDLRDENKRVKTIGLEKKIECPGAFIDTLVVDQYLFLIPCRYPSIVRIDLTTEQIDYCDVSEGVFVRNDAGQWKVGGVCVWNDYILLGSPTDNLVLAVQASSLEKTVLAVEMEEKIGCAFMKVYKNWVYMLPYHGTTIIKWNPANGDYVTFDDMPRDIRCKNRDTYYECMEKPFGMPLICDEFMILPPFWGNCFVKLDLKTKKGEVWDPPFDIQYEDVSGYYKAYCVGNFLSNDTYFDYVRNREIRLDLNMKPISERKYGLSPKEVEEHTKKFGLISEWLMYGCMENACNTLEGFLTADLSEWSYSKDMQIKAFSDINASPDGTCGERVYEFVRSKNNAE